MSAQPAVDRAARIAAAAEQTAALQQAARTFLYFPRPAYAPRRDPSYETELHEIERVAALMGLRLMPWQRYVLEIATEYRRDAFGRKLYHYHDVVVTVPRQSGKTTLIGPLTVYRTLTRPRTAAFYTAQTGHAARQRIKDLVGLITDPAASRLHSLVHKNMEAGAEGFTIPANNSYLRRFSPTESGMHGETPHLVVVDEFWKFTELEGDNLTGAIDPAQITIRQESQTWWISTMGTAQSGFMNKTVEMGRAGADPSTAYFEWSIPEGADPFARASWWLFHPALGNTITEDDLAGEARKARKRDKLGEFLRAFCNRKTGTANPLISDERWQALAVDMAKPSGIALAYDVAPGNAAAAVVASWRDETGRPLTRVIRQAPGTAWVAPYVRACLEHLPVLALAADDGGPTRRITENLRNGSAPTYSDGLEVTTLTLPQFGSACMGWLEAARDAGNLGHDGSPALTAAVNAAALRTINGVSRFSRDEATEPIAALIGSAVGLWAWDNAPRGAGLQIF